MHVVEVQRDVLEVVLDLGVTNAAEEVLGVDLALAVLSLVVVEAEAVDLDDVLADVALLAGQLVADGALEAALVPTGGLPPVV